MSQREILFKAKRTDNWEWAFGDFVHDFRDEGDCIRQGAEYGECGYFKIHQKTVCQYTGLTDKNGKKIFDGDLVKLRTGRVCKVSFRHTHEFCGFDLIPLFETEKPAPKFSVYEGLEVIGNIHDN